MRGYRREIPSVSNGCPKMRDIKVQTLDSPTRYRYAPLEGGLRLRIGLKRHVDQAVALKVGSSGYPPPGLYSKPSSKSLGTECA